MNFYASVSFGKDSLAMLLLLIEKQYPLNEVVFYNTGMEFQAIYNTRDRVLPILAAHNIKYTELYPEQSFLWDMFERPVKKRGTNIVHKYGYSWCGGTCRWGTSQKLKALKNYTKDGIDYVGIAADETHRFEKEKRPNRVLPLVEWEITESQALQYCYEQGFMWEENEDTTPNVHLKTSSNVQRRTLSNVHLITLQMYSFNQVAFWL